MEKLPHYNFSWTVSLSKTLEEAMDLSRDRLILELELFNDALISTLYSVNVRMVNESGAISGMRIGRGN
jgi:hypothetical protein